MEVHNWVKMKLRGPKRWRKLLMILMTVVLFAMCLLTIQPNSVDFYYTVDTEQYDYDSANDDLKPVAQNWRGLTENETKRLSVLGRRLYLGDLSAKPQVGRNFTILDWKHGPVNEKRLIWRFGSKRWDPFQDCSASNCRLTYNSSEVDNADAVIFHLHRTAGKETLPPLKSRSDNQRWIFVTDENPYHTFTMAGRPSKMKDYNGLFNWSMSYRMDCDVPVPYGRTVPLTESDKLLRRKRRRRSKMNVKTKFAAIMMSNCGGKNKRLQYLNQLKKHMPVDVYGACGNLSCEGHFDRDCPKLNDYKFYLAFENGDCREYITEKAWWNAYEKGAVPVIMGASLEDCAKILPPKSYLHVRNFSSPASLARYLLYLNDSLSDYNSFFTWKKKFKIVNEHGYFQSPVYHYCRVCEALNYNDPAPKVYDELENFWDSAKDCYEPVI